MTLLFAAMLQEAADLLIALRLGVALLLVATRMSVFRHQ